MLSHTKPTGVACAALGLILAFAAPARGESPTRVAPESLIVARPAPQPGGVLTLDQALALAAGQAIQSKNIRAVADFFHGGAA